MAPTTPPPAADGASPPSTATFGGSSVGDGHHYALPAESPGPSAPAGSGPAQEGTRLSLNVNADAPDMPTSGITEVITVTTRRSRSPTPSRTITQPPPLIVNGNSQDGRPQVAARRDHSAPVVRGRGPVAARAAAIDSRRSPDEGDKNDQVNSGPLLGDDRNLSQQNPSGAGSGHLTAVLPQGLSPGEARGQGGIGVSGSGGHVLSLIHI